MARNDGVDRISVRNLAVSDKAVGNTQQHNEREKASYRNPDIIPQRAAYYLNKKKKSNKSGYPDEAIKTLARCFYPSMVEFFNSEEGQREYEEWLKEQEALQALPVAA